MAATIIKEKVSHTSRLQFIDDYSMVFLPLTITTNDKSNLRESSSSPRQKHFILSIYKKIVSWKQNIYYRNTIIYYGKDPAVYDHSQARTRR